MGRGRSARGSLGGLGALFFLGTLGTIAFYVQHKQVPDERDVARKAVTMLPALSEPDGPRRLPWEDRLDLADASVVAVVRDAAPKPAAAPEKAEGKAPAKATQPSAAGSGTVDPKNGRLVQDLSDGHRILLTLDPVMHDAALQIFRNREVPYAAAVALDLRDNAVLVLAGHSSMDPEVDPLEVITTAWAPAASTFKLVTTAGLLTRKVATPATKVCFHGGLHGIKDEELQDDPSRDTRCETLGSAVAHSYNLVIAKLAQRHLDQDALSQAARMMLFERAIEFEFPVEPSPAHIPSDPVERAKVAAGFWNVDLSPMHAAVIASVLARRGVYQPPHLIAQVIGPDGSDVTPPRPAPDRVVAKEVAMALSDMMVKTTQIGTARSSFRDKQGNPYIRGVDVAGKTGSLTGKRAPYLNYNWFIGFAPAENPEFAFAVLLANEPRWRIKAHYAARRLVQIYLERRDAIARQRDAKLTKQGVLLPHRDASGALVRVHPTPAKPTKTKAEAKAGSAAAPPDSPQLPPPPQAPALPPVPGPLPPPPTGAP